MSRVLSARISRKLDACGATTGVSLRTGTGAGVSGNDSLFSGGLTEQRHEFACWLRRTAGLKEITNADEIDMTLWM